TDDVLGEANVDDDQIIFFDKTLADALNTSEVFSRVVDYVRNYIDSLSSSEAFSNDVSKVLSEVSSTTDLLSYTSGKTLSDTPSVADVMISSMERILFDPVNL